MRHGYLLSTLLLVAATAHAGVIINGTRLIYQGGKKESSIGISKPGCNRLSGAVLGGFWR
ncbi:Pili assembly chaperone [Enterobacter cancerogenus]|uniref:Pili assembly chaperone n=1 Tax=Enterobacter cancerogenus TaxID=69218 RepID=A0A484WZR3_9ENTR|nr:Pili assembly chaperone [Enterobacter cancerogenus]